MAILTSLTSLVPTPRPISPFPANERELKKGVGYDGHRAMTASARRGAAYSRPVSDAPFVDTRFVDTRFVHAPTPIVPPLDLTRLDDAGNAQNLQPIPLPPSIAATDRKLLFHDIVGAPPPVINPMEMNLAAPLRGEHNRPTDPGNTATAGGDTNLDRKEFTNRVYPAPLSSFQDPGLIHPKPPDVPVPRSERDYHGVELKHESLSARLARLATGGYSRRVVPTELASSRKV